MVSKHTIVNIIYFDYLTNNSTDYTIRRLCSKKIYDSTIVTQKSLKYCIIYSSVSTINGALSDMQTRFKQLRTEKQLTQRNVADIIGCTSATYSKYETGKREPSIDVLCRLADLYGVSVDYLIGRDISSNTPLHDTDMDFLSRFRKLRPLTQEIFISTIELLDDKLQAPKDRK